LPDCARQSRNSLPGDQPRTGGGHLLPPPVYIEIPRDMVSVKVTPVEEKLVLPDMDKGPFKEACWKPPK